MIVALDGLFVVRFICLINIKTVKPRRNSSFGASLWLGLFPRGGAGLQFGEGFIKGLFAVFYKTA